MSIELFLSPHLDDAAISCGGFIYQLTRGARQVMVVTICAGAPSYPVSPYAEQLHKTWGMSNAADVIAMRKAEDLRASAITGAEIIHLDFLDALYRRNASGWLYQSWSDITGPAKDPDDFAIQIADAVADAVGLSEAGTIYAPLGAGRHVDHELTHRGAHHLAKRGHEVLLYEDIPYVFFGAEVLTDALHCHFTVTPPMVLVPLTAADHSANVDAIMSYASQHAFDRTTADARLREYRRSATQDGTLAQRLWRLPS